jgi:hypothetical protein
MGSPHVIAGAFSSGDAAAADATQSGDASLDQDTSQEAWGYDDIGDEQL